jgi:predicted anti-sigma-YlaC factor YlaD
MNRKKLKKLSLYLDGEMNPEDQRRMEQHLRECSECREALRSFRSLKKVAPFFEHKPSPYFVTRVLAARRSGAEESFWAGFDFLPRPLVRASLIVSTCLLLSFTLLTGMIGQQQTATAENGDSMLHVVAGDQPSLNTDEQALEYALLNGYISTQGE